MFFQVIIFGVTIIMTGFVGLTYYRINKADIYKHGTYIVSIDNFGVVPLLLLWTQQLAFQSAAHASINRLVLTTVIGVVLSVITCLLVRRHSERCLREYNNSFRMQKAEAHLS